MLRGHHLLTPPLGDFVDFVIYYLIQAQACEVRFLTGGGDDPKGYGIIAL